MIGGMRQSTTNALVQRFTGSPTDVVGFSNALRHLAASSSREQALGVLLTETGEVLAISSPAGRVSTWAQVSLDEVEPIEVEVEGDGASRDLSEDAVLRRLAGHAEHDIEGRTIAGPRRRGGRLLVVR